MIVYAQTYITRYTTHTRIYNIFIKLLNLIVRGEYKSFVAINQNTNIAAALKSIKNHVFVYIRMQSNMTITANIFMNSYWSDKTITPYGFIVINCALS